MQKLIMYLLALACSTGAIAQNTLGDRLQQAKFAIIKRTVEFLSTDDSTFKQVKSTTCDNCKNINDLKAFAKSNNLTNAESMVIDPLYTEKIDSSADRWEKSLNRFRQLAIDRVITSRKKWREKLKSHDEYIASINSIVEKVKPVSQPVARQVQPPAPKPLVQQEQPAADTTAVAAKTGATTENSSMSVYLRWLPYVLSALLLGLVAYLLSTIKQLKKRKAYHKEKVEQLRLKIAENEQTIATLNTQKDKLAKELSDSELDRTTLVDRLKLYEIKEIPAPENEEPEILVTVPDQPVTKAYIQKPKPAPNIKYAKYADMGDGFSNAELLSKPDNETIFELTLEANNTGEYKITNNPDVHRYALLNAQYFLGKTCRYDSFPFENASIKTDLPGTIKLNGGKWIITSPARISFS